MIRKKRTYRASDEEYQIIKASARANGRTTSEFVRYSALADAKKHLKRQGLKDMLKPLLLELLQEVPRACPPVRGNEAETVLSGGL